MAEAKSRLAAISENRPSKSEELNRTSDASDQISSTTATTSPQGITAVVKEEVDTDVEGSSPRKSGLAQPHDDMNAPLPNVSVADVLGRAHPQEIASAPRRSRRCEYFGSNYAEARCEKKAKLRSRWNGKTKLHCCGEHQKGGDEQFCEDRRNVSQHPTDGEKPPPTQRTNVYLKASNDPKSGTIAAGMAARNRPIEVVEAPRGKDWIERAMGSSDAIKADHGNMPKTNRSATRDESAGSATVPGSPCPNAEWSKCGHSEAYECPFLFAGNRMCKKHREWTDHIAQAKANGKAGISGVTVEETSVQFKCEICTNDVVDVSVRSTEDGWWDHILSA